ncbi:MAG: aminoacyl-tRNA deacylase [Gammaproteobacteria bacterium]
MAVGNIRDFLDHEHIRYKCIKHSPSITAQETAQSAHIHGKELAKTVIVKIGDKLAMVVLTANDKVNFSHLTQSLGGKPIQLASEREFRDQFPNCELGAMPPFGNLYGMEVFVDRKLSEDPEIAFNAGSHSELIRMAYADFAKVVHPQLIQAS